MPALIFLALLQSALLTLGQVTLKISLAQFPAFSWSLRYFGAVFGNLWFAACGLCFGAASLLWMYIVKHFAFHQAFPMVSDGNVGSSVYLSRRSALHPMDRTSLYLGGCGTDFQIT